jgi:putative molybdopterin biosynthesis protein
MIELHVDESVQTPLYRQIVDQVKQLIASSKLQSGERLPTVRQLAVYLHINTGTVARAYLELEKERMISSRRGGGTVVSVEANDPQFHTLRQNRLSSITSSTILDALSLGYTPEEIEAAFSIHLSRWREERSRKEDLFKKLNQDISQKGKTITIVGSHDLALNLLISQVKSRNPEITVDVTYAGSLGGLIAIQENRADLAGIHLLDEETGEYNYPYVKHILPGKEVAIVHLAYRIQGLLFASDNPMKIRGIEDLGNPGITFVNRQKGSGTRLLLDLKLRQQGIVPKEITGYEREVDTHTAVAACISKGEADVGLGIEAAARSFGLGFLPLFRERYDLVIPIANYRSALFSPLLAIVKSDDFKKAVLSAGGYDMAQTGSTSFY